LGKYLPSRCSAFILPYKAFAWLLVSQRNDFSREDTKPLSHRPGRDSQESLLLLLDVSEVFPQLKQECLDSAAIARLWATVHSDITRKEEWEELYRILDDCERDYEQMVLRFRLDPVLLFTIYRHMLAVKNRWLGYRIHDLSRSTRPGSAVEGDTGPEELDDEYTRSLRNLETMWDNIMTNIKKMLVACC
jgi:hypothetical protein